ncbi:MAG: DUF2865 domain-containing protein [Rhizobiaceae bacterium]
MNALNRSYGIARHFFLPALSLCVLLVASAGVSAQSRVCRQIEAELAALAGGGNSAQFRKYDRAVKTQQNQLRKAERAARRAGCKTGSLSILGLSGNGSQCRSLVSTIRRMEQNLTQLERRRSRYEGGGSLAKRARLMTRLTINGCREREQVANRERQREKTRRKSPREVNILDQIFDNRSKRRGPLEDDNGNRVKTVIGGGRAAPLDDAPAASFRTLCVRTCDGYYFPISFSATDTDFDRDQKVCQAMCPGTDVQLYYHKVPEEESEDMVSLAGEPYKELATAFLYRQAGYQREKSCGCNPHKDFSVIAGSREAYEERETAEPFIPLPVKRPDPASDPETLANRDGGLTPDVIARILTPPPEADDEDPLDRKVRVVGPVFLPDPEGAIDLRTQGQPNVQ